MALSTNALGRLPFFPVSAPPLNLSHQGPANERGCQPLQPSDQ